MTNSRSFKLLLFTLLLDPDEKAPCFYIINFYISNIINFVQPIVHYVAYTFHYNKLELKLFTLIIQLLEFKFFKESMLNLHLGISRCQHTDLQKMLPALPKGTQLYVT